MATRSQESRRLETTFTLVEMTRLEESESGKMRDTKPRARYGSGNRPLCPRFARPARNRSGDPLPFLRHGRSGARGIRRRITDSELQTTPVPLSASSSISVLCPGSSAGGQSRKLVPLLSAFNSRSVVRWPVPLVTVSMRQRWYASSIFGRRSSTIVSVSKNWSKVVQASTCPRR